MWIRRILLGVCATLALIAFSGCTTHEKRKVRVIEEERAGEVVEEEPGEMVVE